MLSADNVIADIANLSNPTKALGLARFFQTAPGQYAEGDKFLGLTVPVQRTIAKKYAALDLEEALKLLRSAYHEHRLTSLIILVNRYKKASPEEQERIYHLYLNNTAYINNWDLVDVSAEHIVGPFLQNRDKAPLYTLAKSTNIWERRIAMLACFHYIKRGQTSIAFSVIELLKNDSHDLIQKAVGWMLREIGKRCSQDELTAWLLNDDTYKKLPRTTLRYAIEHYLPEKRKQFLAGIF